MEHRIGFAAGAVFGSKNSIVNFNRLPDVTYKPACCNVSGNRLQEIPDGGDPGRESKTAIARARRSTTRSGSPRRRCPSRSPRCRGTASSRGSAGDGPRRGCWPASGIRRSTSTVAREGPALAGFGIMEYGDGRGPPPPVRGASATPPRRGRRRPRALAGSHRPQPRGSGLIRLEARVNNPEARGFYRALGYRETRTIRGFYRGREDAVSIAKDLWAG